MTTSTPRRVVVADDSALMRQIVSNSLTRAGFDVVGTAADGDEALALCERERPDAMTLDLAMPGLDGLGVLRKLKEQRGPALAGRRGLRVLPVSGRTRRRRARRRSVRPGVEAVRRRGSTISQSCSRPRSGSLRTLERDVAGRRRTQTGSRQRRGGSRMPARRRPLHGLCGAAGRPAVVIATSTGGPRALAACFRSFPPRSAAAR